MDLGCSCPCIHTGWCFDFWILKISPKIILTCILLMFWHLYLFWFWTFGNPGWPPPPPPPSSSFCFWYRVAGLSIWKRRCRRGILAFQSLYFPLVDIYFIYCACRTSFLSLFSSYATRNNPRKSYQSMNITTRPVFNLSGLNANLYM